MCPDVSARRVLHETVRYNSADRALYTIDLLRATRAVSDSSKATAVTGFRGTVESVPDFHSICGKEFGKKKGKSELCLSHPPTVERT